jgi:hypothetical protein
MKRALGVNDLVTEGGISRTTVFAEIRKGALVARKVGRRTIVTRDDFECWLQNLPKRSVEG